ncbi:unnamed protein product [Merluccius merluccius]
MKSCVTVHSAVQEAVQEQFSTPDGRLLKAMDGSHVDCVVQSHPALLSAAHLLPQNTLVSGDDLIPGLAPSPTGDALLSPKLLKLSSYSLSRLTVSLQPSLDRFESRLLQLVSADWDATQVDVALVKLSATTLCLFSSPLSFCTANASVDQTMISNDFICGASAAGRRGGEGPALAVERLRLALTC